MNSVLLLIGGVVAALGGALFSWWCLLVAFKFAVGLAGETKLLWAFAWARARKSQELEDLRQADARREAFNKAWRENDPSAL